MAENTIPRWSEVAAQPDFVAADSATKEEMRLSYRNALALQSMRLGASDAQVDSHLAKFDEISKPSLVRRAGDSIARIAAGALQVAGIKSDQAAQERPPLTAAEIAANSKPAFMTPGTGANRKVDTRTGSVMDGVVPMDATERASPVAPMNMAAYAAAQQYAGTNPTGYVDPPKRNTVAARALQSAASGIIAQRSSAPTAALDRAVEAQSGAPAFSVTGTTQIGDPAATKPEADDGYFTRVLDTQKLLVRGAAEGVGSLARASVEVPGRISDWFDSKTAYMGARLMGLDDKQATQTANELKATGEGGRRALIDPMASAGGRILDYLMPISESTKRITEKEIFSGNPLKGELPTLNPDSSLFQVVAKGYQTLGQMAPIILGGLLGGARTAAAFGFGQAADEGGSEEGKRIRDMSPSDLRNIPLYKQYRNEGLDHAQAKLATEADAARWSSLVQGFVGSLDGLLFPGAGAAARKSVAAAFAKGGTIQGGQEGLEDIGSRTAASLAVGETLSADRIGKGVYDSTALGAVIGGPTQANSAVSGNAEIKAGEKFNAKIKQGIADKMASTFGPRESAQTDKPTAKPKSDSAEAPVDAGVLLGKRPTQQLSEQGPNEQELAQVFGESRESPKSAQSPIAAGDAEKSGKVFDAVALAADAVQPAGQMQNRDRARAASVVQMNAIANKPDYDLAGPSNSPEMGAPMASIVGNAKELPPEQVGRAVRVPMADGSKIPTRYAVVEADEAIASNKVDGSVVNAYYDAAPGIVRVLNNGRTAGLQAAYERGNMADYRAQLEADAESHGIKPEVIKGMKQPLLIRLYNDKENARGNMGKLSNTSNAMDISSAERATQDAATLDISGLAQNEDGTISVAGSRDFIARFIQNIPAQERAAVATKDGNYSRELVQRVENAVFAKAYGDEKLISMFSEENEPDVKNVLTALRVASPNFARAGDLKTWDVRPMLTGAISTFRKAKKDGQSVAEVLAQQDFEGRHPLHDGFLATIADNIRKPKKLGLLLAEIADSANLEAASTGGLFGEASEASLKEVINRANQNIRDKFGDDAVTLNVDEAVLFSRGRRSSDGAGTLDLFASNDGVQPEVSRGPGAASNAAPVSGRSGQPQSGKAEAAGAVAGDIEAAGFKQIRGTTNEWTQTIEETPNRVHAFNLRKLGGDAPQYRLTTSTRFAGASITGAPTRDLGMFGSEEKALAVFESEKKRIPTPQSERPSLELASQSNAEILAREKAQAKAEADKLKADAVAEVERKEAADAADLRARAKATVDDFQLGGDANAQMAGQGSLFKRNETKRATLSKDAVQRAVYAINKAWPNAPTTIVLASMDEAPVAVQAEDMKQRRGGADGSPRGFVYGGKVHLVAAEMTGLQDIVETMLHEVAGHYGLRRAFGADLTKILADVARLRKDDVLAKAKQYGLDPKDERNLMRAAEEVLAEMAETEPTAGLVRRVIAAIRKFLRGLPGFENMKLSDNDIIVNYLIPARDSLRYGVDGKKFSGVPVFSRATNDEMANDKAVVGNTTERSADDGKEGGARAAINTDDNRSSGDSVQRAAMQERSVRAETSGRMEPTSNSGAAASEAKRTPFTQETETLPRGALTDKLLALRAVPDKLNRPHVYKVLALINEASKSKALGSTAVFDAAKAEMKSLIEQANALTDNPSLKGFVGGQWGSVPKQKAVQPVARASSPKPSIALSAIDGLLQKADQATDQSERLDAALDAMKLAIRNGSAAAEDLFWQARDIAQSVVEEANSKLESDFLTSGVFKNPENLMRNRDIIEIIRNGENPRLGIHDHSARFDRATLNIVSSGNWSIDRLTNTADFKNANEPTTSQDGDVAFSRGRGEGRKTGYPSDAPEPVHVFRNDAPMKADPNYKAAKAGDVDAAIALVKAIVPDAIVAKAKEKFGADAVYLPVHAIEATGENAIPTTFAAMLAQRTGATLATGIVQSNLAGHTGANAMERLVSGVTFTGDVVKSARYVLVDDVTTMGGTFADLSDYVTANGGKIIGSVVLVDASRNATIKPSPRTVRELERRYGNEIRSEFEVEPIALTASEADYLIGFKTADELANRAATARTENARRQSAKGAQPDVAFSRAGAGKSPPAPPSQTSLPLQGNNQQWTAPTPSKLDSVIYTLQDKLIDTKRVVVAIKNARQQLVDTWNPYLKEEMFHGRSAKRTANFLKVELVPLLESLQKAGVPIEDFEKFLHARHAEERNVRIAAINPQMPDAGSGMATADARAYLSSVANKPQLEALAKRVDAITQKTRDTLRDYGLVSNAEIQTWNTMYPNYVPLMRDDDGGRGTGQGFSIKGAETKRAMGSTKAVTNILANVAMQRERAIVRGEKNRVAIALYGLAKLNPNKDFWETDTPPMMRFIGKDGLVDSMVDPNYKNLDNVVVAKVYHTSTDKVTEHAVVFNEDDERAARMALALKNLDINQLGEVLGTVAKATRYLAAINTQYNPIFGVVNLVRDVQGAAFNLTSTPLANKKAAVLKEIPAALRAVYRAERDKPAQSKYAALWDEFQSVGGPTGYRDLYASPQDRADAIKSEIAKMTEGKVKAAGRAVFDWLSDYNQAMENSVRLAAYKVALDEGMTKEQAASLAKNLTVNFNRKGQIGQQAGSLYAFFNASVQGTARLAETLNGKAGKKIIAGGLLLGVIQALALMGNDDDDPPQFTREKNLIIPLGFKKYVAIPMPLGLHVIPNTSRILTEMFLHGEPLKRTGQLLSGLVDAFSPTGSVGMSVQTVLPTVIDPLAALSENRDWMGRKIYREDFSSLSPTPGHTRTKDTASWVSKQLSVFMNWATGGTEFVKGGLSPTADQIDFLVGQVTGGTGREVIKAEQSVMSLFTGDDLPTYKILFVGRFYGEIDSPASAAGKFYRNLTKQNEHEATIKGLYKSERDASDYMRDNPDSNLFAAGDAYQRAIAKLQERKREEKKRDEPRETTRATEKEIEGLMRDFNQMVDDAKKTK